MSIETINATIKLKDIEPDGQPIPYFNGDVTEYFTHIRQRHITLTQDLLATRQMLLQERDQVNTDQVSLRQVESQYYTKLTGSNQKLRDIELKEKLDRDDYWIKVNKLLAQGHANIAVCEGRLEELKHAIRRAEYELRFCCALLEGNRHE